MANYEMMIDMDRCKHDLQQIEVSKSDMAKPERLLSAKEMTRYPRWPWKSLDGLLIIAVTQPSFGLSERLGRQNDETIQDMLKWNKMIRSARSIECKLKIHSIPINHLRFMGVRDAAHANVEGGATQQAHVIQAVHKNVTGPKVSASADPELEQLRRSREWSAAVWLLKHAAWQRAWNSWIW